MDEKNDTSIMEITEIKANAQNLAQELKWFANILNGRIDAYFKPNASFEITSVEAPELKIKNSPYAYLVNKFEMNYTERLVLILALVPHIKPNLLDILYTKNENFNRGYSEFGGVNGNFHSGFIPTGETASFIIAGDNLETRFLLKKIFNEEHFFYRHNILKLEGKVDQIAEPEFSKVLSISPESLSLLTTGEVFKPGYSTKFPAERISTQLNWDELVLDDHVRDELDDVITWIKHGDTLMNDWGLKRKVKQGYRAMFYGPPGTGKTLTATLIGKTLGIDVYRVDLSMIVSKYIGETEKNLARVFDQAATQNWILFFDEADALFGKRTATSSSNDRHANQEVAYLLQRIEDFPGVIILASNLKGNLDDAFLRRFQTMVYFPVPNQEQRCQLWNNAFDPKIQLEQQVDLNTIARDYEICGGSIVNVLRHCTIKAMQRNIPKVLLKDIENGIKKELRKEGKA
ncbi:MAG: AAA+ superfamily predicted ATPase [Sphingobacteriales bacterium]